MSKWRSWGGVGGALAIVALASGARAGTTEEQLQKLDARILALEDKLTASEATIAAQRAQIASIAPDVSQGGSAIDAFFQSLQVGGHVTGSYIYNFNRPDNQAFSQPLGQFNVDHNTFTVDAVKLELGKPAENPGTVGFQAELLFGANARILNALADPFTDSAVHVQEAYVAYNWSDVLLRLGKFETLLGYEVLDSPYNPNISHGLLYTLAIPLFHAGLLASGNFTEQTGWALGLVNGWNNASEIDRFTNDNKGVLGQLSWGGGPLFTSLSAYFGADGDTGFVTHSALGPGTSNVNSDDALVVDFVGKLKAAEGLDFWLNVDWGRQDNVVFTVGEKTGQTGDADWYGAALGVAMAFNERTGLALRAEYFRDEDGYRIFPGLSGDDIDVYGLTGTLSYSVLENLKARAELRYDIADDDTGTNDLLFPQGNESAGPGAAPIPGGFNPNNQDDQLLGIVEVSYLFD